MNRRGFLKGILAACVAPAFVPVERLMRIKPIVTPAEFFGSVRIPLSAFNQCGKSDLVFAQFLKLTREAQAGELQFYRDVIADLEKRFARGIYRCG